MGWLSSNQNKSMLGQLLVKQKLITEEQLASAIELQRKTGQRLGDIFADLNLITQEHIENALRKQRRLRMAAAIATSLLAPLETYAASALPAAALTASAGQQPRPARAERRRTGRHLGARPERRPGQRRRHAKGNNLEVVGEISKLLNPVLASSKPTPR
jgi:hypothetical protein